MSLKKLIMNDLKDAMKSKDKPRLVLVRSIKSEIKYKEIELGRDINDEEITKVIMKMIKSRKESSEQYEAANRMDLVEEEKKEIELLTSYMPKALSEEELKEIVSRIQKEENLVNKKDMGKLIKKVLAEVGSRADGKIVSSIVKETLL